MSREEKKPKKTKSKKGKYTMEMMMINGEEWVKKSTIPQGEEREHEATCEKSSHVGNAAKLGEALNELLGVFDSGLVKYSDSCDHSDTAQIQYVIDKAEAALAAPPRNCDVGTPEEQLARFKKQCDRHSETHGNCFGCPCLKTSGACEFHWTQMPYE